MPVVAFVALNLAKILTRSPFCLVSAMICCCCCLTSARRSLVAVDICWMCSLSTVAASTMSNNCCYRYMLPASSGVVSSMLAALPNPWQLSVALLNRLCSIHSGLKYNYRFSQVLRRTGRCSHTCMSYFSKIAAVYSSFIASTSFCLLVHLMSSSRRSSCSLSSC